MTASPGTNIPRYVFRALPEFWWWLGTTFGIPVVILLLTSLVGVQFESFTLTDWKSWALSAAAASIRAVIAIALSLLRTWITGESGLIQKS